MTADCAPTVPLQPTRRRAGRPGVLAPAMATALGLAAAAAWAQDAPPSADPRRATLEAGAGTSAADDSAILDLCFKSLNDLREANEDCTRNLRSLGQTAPAAPCPPPAPSCPPPSQGTGPDAPSAALIQCRRDLDTCTARPCTTTAALPGWAQPAIAYLIARDLDLLPTSPCRRIDVALDAQGTRASVTLVVTPEIYARTVSARGNVAQALPELALDWSQGTPPADCAATPNPVKPPESKPPEPPRTDGDPTLRGYQVLYEGDQATLLKASQITADDRRRLPTAAECSELGPLFEKRVPMERRSLPAFFVQDADRVLVCETSGGTWRVERRRRPMSPEAHLLVKP